MCRVVRAWEDIDKAREDLDGAVLDSPDSKVKLNNESDRIVVQNSFCLHNHVGGGSNGQQDVSG